MTFLLDTDTVSAIVRRRQPVSPLRWLEEADPATLAISSITIGELLYGAARLGLQGDGLANRIEGQVIQRFRAVPFEVLAARGYGFLRAFLEREGTPIGDADTRIAAIALANDLTVVTGNVRHFDRVPGLRVENWMEQRQ